MLCDRCKCQIEEMPHPLGKVGGKPAYFDWTILKDLRPGTEDSILVPQGAYASIRGVARCGRRYAHDMGIKVRTSNRSNGVRFWRLA